MQQTERQFDRESMLDRLGGDDELLVEVIQLFIDECPSMLDQVRGAVSAADADAVKRSAHTMKGALLNIAADPPAELARRLERMGHDGTLDGADAGLSDLEAALTALDDELKQIVANG